ncbi:hypothetical protein [Pontivivens ytuae]|uniref:YMGG-like Gly-zipper domain-containing protein n=1 Tax=Pontivivens ytuae TaxID=2789856 RepID=A0A7S9QEF8_9RHOB|nr:hypothetical protein [Pontivivens ytuae]QPH55146.1 hypothetical protein I0K15_05200 [Pontivivens ytuae]
MVKSYSLPALAGLGILLLAGCNGVRGDEVAAGAVLGGGLGALAAEATDNEKTEGAVIGAAVGAAAVGSGTFQRR